MTVIKRFIIVYIIKKCGWMVSKRGKMTRTEAVGLPEGKIGDIQDSYKYLGIPKTDLTVSLSLQDQRGLGLLSRGP